MATTYTYITKLQPSGVTSTSFTSISQSYDDLVVHYSVKTNDVGNNQQNLRITLNGNNGSIYAWNTVPDDYTGTAYVTYLNPGLAVTASFQNPYGFACGQLLVPSYTSSSLAKQMFLQTGAQAAANSDSAISALYANTTAAITQITFTCNTYASQTFVSGSTFWLYGIKRS